LASDGLVAIPQAPPEERYDRQTGEAPDCKWYRGTINGYLPKGISIVTGVNLTTQVAYLLQDLERKTLCV
jgi:hypothetical protein